MQASIALPVYTSHGIQTSQFFTGLRLMGAEMTYCNVVRMVRETCLRQQSVGDDDSLSTIEIMCHPGVSFDDPGERKIGGCGSGMEEDLYDNGVDAFCISTDRDTEFNTLTDPRLKHFLKRENLILCSWQNAFSRKSMHLHMDIVWGNMFLNDFDLETCRLFVVGLMRFSIWYRNTIL